MRVSDGQFTCRPPTDPGSPTDEILEAIALLEGLPAARCNAEGNAPLKVEGILYLLHVRLARAERAAQHILPSAAHSCRPR